MFLINFMFNGAKWVAYSVGDKINCPIGFYYRECWITFLTGNGTLSIFCIADDSSTAFRFIFINFIMLNLVYYYK